MSTSIKTRIKNKIDTAQNWKSQQRSSLVLLSGEVAFEKSTSDGAVNFKVGDGVQQYANLPYAMTKTYVKDPSSQAYASGKQSDLSVIKLSKEEYASVLHDDASQPNALYIISSDFQDAFGQQVKNMAAGTDLSDAVTVEQLNATVSDYMPLSGGETVKEIVLCGNFTQTNTPDSVYIYSDNSFFQAESTEKYGSASIGSRGFIILDVVSAENKVILSADGLSNVNDCIPESCYASAWSIALDNKLDTQFSEISAVGTDYVVFKSPFKAVAALDGEPESYFTNLLAAADDNALYCPTHPEVGNTTIKTFTSNHAEGGSTHAIAQYSHAEGRYTFAEGRYSHSEGHGTIAGGTAAHAEGERCIASGEGAHAEGRATKATGNFAHAEGGQKNSSTSYNVGGWATGDGAHAEGVQTSAFATAAHAEGKLTYAGKFASHAEGWQTSADGEFAYAGGYKAYANANNQFVWNGASKATSDPVYTGNDGIYASGQYKGYGTFNVNPMGGLSGFYVGENNLASYLDQKQDQLSSAQLYALDKSTREYQTRFKVVTTSSYKKAGIYSAERDDTTKPVIIDWGDGTVEQVNGDVSQKVHEYATESEFEATISNVKTFTASTSNSTWYQTTSQNRYALREVALGSSVTSIENQTFNGCEKLVSVTIPDSVTSIGSYAFYQCYNLTSVTIPDSVTSIGWYAFYECWYLSSVTIPSSVTSIGSSAFCCCSHLTSVTISNGVESIGNSTFQNCTRLTNVTIPDSVTSIGNRAFESCSQLTSVMIGNSVTSIGEYAFNSCTNLAKIIFKNHQSSQIPSGSPWGAPSTTVIETWNDASQEWVSSQISANLTSADISATYADQHIYLSAAGQVVGDIDCSDFIKDGMLSSVELCSNQLIFKFNTDSEQDPISVDLSSFVDNYDATIQAISAEVSALPTKANIEEGWWSEWTAVVTTVTNISVTGLPFYQLQDQYHNEFFGWFLPTSIGNMWFGVRDEYVDTLAVDKSQDDWVLKYTATRQRIAGHTPTKTSDLSNDSGFLTEHQSLSNCLQNNSLSGQTFDFSDMRGLYTAISCLVAACGGTVINFPTFNQ